MTAIYAWASAHPVEAIVLVSLLAGALGDVGRLLEPSSPRLAGLFKILSSLGVSFVGVARGIRPSAPRSDRDERGATAVDVLATVAAAGAAGLIAYALSGCGAGASAAAYGARLEACLQTSQTCEGYVRCRDEVQRAEGRGPYNGRCEPADAGPDVQVVDAQADALEADAAREGGVQ